MVEITEATEKPTLTITTGDAPAGKEKIKKPEDKDWNHYIPKEIRHDIEYALDRTREDNNEKSLTFCRIKGSDKIHTSAYAKGVRGSTEVKPCDERWGKSDKIGDFHSHPIDKITIGITPSEADSVSNIVESRENGIRQISCISSVDSKMIHCFQPKKMPDRKKVRNYIKALEEGDYTHNDISPYVRQNVGKDLKHAWYDKKTWNLIKNPSPDDIVTDALGPATRTIRNDYKHEIEKGTFCDLIQNMNKPDDDRVGVKCREEVKDRRFNVVIPKNPIIRSGEPIKIPGIEDVPSLLEEVPYVGLEKIERIPYLNEFTHL
jgi:hypothetical protein